MDAGTVKDRMGQELVGISSITNSHGVELRLDRITPEKREYENSFSPNETLTLWCIIAEDGGGYEIVFDEVGGRFGLATSTKDGRHAIIGFHPTLIDAFRSM